MKKQVVIIGAGAGGASVAAEVRRKNPELSIVMLEKAGNVSTAA